MANTTNMRLAISAILSRFMELLPYDVRTVVYRYLFAGLVLTRGDIMWRDRVCGFPAILHANQEIRKDALPLFYKMATFRLDQIDFNIAGAYVVNDWQRYRLRDREEYAMIQGATMDLTSTSFRNWAPRGLPVMLEHMPKIQHLTLRHLISPFGEITTYHIEDVEEQYELTNGTDAPWEWVSVHDFTATEEEIKALRNTLVSMELREHIQNLSTLAWWAREFRRVAWELNIDYARSKFCLLPEGIDTDDSSEEDNEDQSVDLRGLRAFVVLTKEGINLLDECPFWQASLSITIYN